MASLLRRLGAVSKVWLNGLMEPAEDPRQTFANAFQRQRDLLARVRHAQQTLAQARTRLQAKADETRAKLEQLEGQARQALRESRQDLARLALRRRHITAIELRALDEQLNGVQRQEQKLALVEQRLSTQIEAFHAQQQVMAARYSAAEAQVRIHESLTRASQDVMDLGLELESVSQQTEHMQARATAIDELLEAGVLELPVLGSDLVERDFGGVEVAEEIEEQLRVMRLELAAKD